MRRLTSLIALVLVVVVFLPSCKKFNDCYIVEFSLTVQNEKYLAAIADDKITVQLPDNVDLRGAVVDYKLSEGASISPDPASVSDWSVERQFLVTSNTQESKKYVYIPVFKGRSGDVVLKTQADVNNFKSRHLTVIEGNLIIGTPLGEKITNLDSLEHLKEVGRSLIINSSYGGESLSGLQNLESVGSFLLGTFLDSSRCANIKDVSLPSLREVKGDFIIVSGTVETVAIPKVRVIKGEAYLALRVLADLRAGALTEVGRSFIVRGDTQILERRSATTPKIEHMVFDSLSTVNGRFTVETFLYLKDVSTPRLTSVGGSLTFQDLFNLGALSMPKLEEVGGVYIHARSLEMLSFPMLQTCSGYFLVVEGDEKPLKSVDISSLVNQKGDMEWRSLSKEVKFNPNIDFNGHWLILSHNNPDSFTKMTGASVFKGSIRLICVKNFAIEGISRLTGSLDLVGGCGQFEFSFSFDTIDGNFIVAEDNGIREKLLLKNLKRVGGISVNTYSGNREAEYDFSNLEEVVNSCYFRIRDHSHLNFPALGKIGGDLNVVLQWGAKDGVFSCPKLTDIGGGLTIGPHKHYNSPEGYTVDFSALAAVNKVTIRKQSWFKDFTMFSGLFTGDHPAITQGDQWYVNDCGYNPTFEDMKAGRYKQ